MQKIKIAEEKRKIQDDMKRKKEEMMKKFEKLLKKGKLMDKEEFYKQIFNENFSPSSSGDLGGGLSTHSVGNFERERSTIAKKEAEGLEEDKFKSNKSFKNLNKKENLNSSNKNENLDLNTSQQEKINSSKINITEENKETVRNLSPEEIKEKINEKKKQLEHELLDVITKNEIEEKKLLDEIKEDDSEEDKIRKNEDYNAVKNKNQQKVNQIKE